MDKKPEINYAELAKKAKIQATTTRQNVSSAWLKVHPTPKKSVKTNISATKSQKGTSSSVPLPVDSSAPATVKDEAKDDIDMAEIEEPAPDDTKLANEEAKDPLAAVGWNWMPNV
ncbi:hypothetical protein M011DRAFT_472405 [Sporormia fimetaria CBS 119925]|uniref:Uncharacterized protein n=1 Tax=Sporormia fimetaria CBS 119925 TaxID=1340428 RepID=A0A6A6UXP4_9PLEO|nr:hypothetical protein M011DRAFT_472405 [Sporormia fimetaria CBS 119925]